MGYVPPRDRASYATLEGRLSSLRPNHYHTTHVQADFQESTAAAVIPPDVPAVGVEISTGASADPADVYLAQLASANSRRAVENDLNIMARMLTGGEGDRHSIPWERLRYEHVAAIRGRLMGQYAPASANRMLSSVRGVLRTAWKMGLLSAEELQRALSVDPVKGSRLPAGRALTAGEIRTLFRACAEDTRPAGVRDAALLAVLYGAGVRRAEAVELDVADFTAETGAIRIRSGKGNKDRLTYVQGMGAMAVEVWLDVRRREPGPLFVPIHRSGRVRLQRMREQSIYDILNRRADGAGIPSFSPHDLRRTFAGDLLDAGADISTVQQLLGHASVTTTQRYDRRGEATKRRATSLLHVPYVP